MARRERQRQLDMDFGDRRRWEEFPEPARRACIELLSRLLAGIVLGTAGAEGEVEEVGDERS